MQPMRRHLEALFHRSRCKRHVLIPMLDKLTDEEMHALYHMIVNHGDDQSREQRRAERVTWPYPVKPW